MIYVHLCACDKQYLNKPAGSKTSSSYGIFEKKIYAKRGVSYMGFKLSFWLPVIPVEINPSRKDMTSSAEACLKLLITIQGC